MSDTDTARWLRTIADMIDNAQSIAQGRIVRLELSRHMAEQMQDAAQEAAEQLCPTLSAWAPREDLRLPSFVFERKEAE